MLITIGNMCEIRIVLNKIGIGGSSIGIFQLALIGAADAKKLVLEVEPVK